jgi:O-antigen/teichoic acid export membrane protein
MLRGFTQILGLALSAFFLYRGYGLIGLSVAWVLQGVIVRVAGWIALRRMFPSLSSSNGTASMVLFKRIVTPSLKLAATGLGAVLILQTDNVVIASVLGPAAIPPYEAVAKLANHCFGLSMLVISSSTPFMSKFYATGDMEGVRNLTLKNVRYSMAFMAIVVSFLALFGDLVIHIWLGSNNFIGFPVLWAFLAMLTLEVHHNILGSATMATGQVVFYWVALVAGILNIALTLVLVKYLGLLGVALGTMCAQLLTNNWYVTLVSLKVFQIPVSDYIKRTVIPLGLLFLVMLAANRGLRFLVQPLTELSGLVLAFCVSVSFGTFLSGYMILNKQERQEILVKLLSWRPSL